MAFVLASAHVALAQNGAGVHELRIELDFEGEGEGQRVRYRSPTADVLGHSQSGEVTSYSPDGRYLGLLVGDQWKLVDRSDGRRVLDAHPRVYAGASNNVLQWTPDGLLMRVRGNQLEFWSPESRSVVRSVALPAIDVGPLLERESRTVAWRNWRTGDATGEHFLHVVHSVGLAARPGEAGDSGLIHSWIALVDTREREVTRVFAFDEKIHRGDGTAGRWHHLFASGAFFLANLSAMGPEGNPHFLFERDGSGWRRLNRIGPHEIDDPRSLAWSHVTYDANHVAFGYDHHVYVADFLSGRRLARFTHPREQNGGYGHGCLAGPYLVYSFFDRAVGSDRALYFWNWRDEAAPRRIEVFDLPVTEAARAAGFLRRLRPFLSRAGDEVAWHEIDAAGRIAVVTRDPRPTRTQGAAR